MRTKTHLNRALGATVTAALAMTMPVAAIAQARQKARVASLPAGTERPTREVLLSIGEGELVTLPTAVTNVWTSNPGVADVYVANPRQIHLFGKEFGEATIFATTANGTVVYSTNVRVSQNITSIDRMIKAAMPEADIKVTTVGQLAVLSGTVASPDDSEQAQRLVLAALNPGVNVSDPNAQLKIMVMNRLKTATPLQVNLQVRFAEVSRSFVKDIGVNLATRDQTGGFQFGVQSGTRSPGTIGTPNLSNLPVLDASSRFGFPAGTISLPFDPAKGDFVLPGTGSTYQIDKGTKFSTLGLAGKLLGLDVLGALDLGERIGQVTTLTNPNLTALSGETSTFLAGGEIPMLVSQALGQVSVEYKPYGVSLAFTPTVLSDGRISLRVRPEVSTITTTGAISVGSTQIPALTTRRAETTVELGSGESMVIGGLLQNSHDNSIDKTPGLGDVPVLGALFRSNGFRRNETELVIVITPYLVKPVNANQIVLPTDGYKAPDDFERIIGGDLVGNKAGGDRPKPSMAPSGATPTVGAFAPGPALPAAPAPQPAKAAPAPSRPKKGGAAAPGFGF
ncbi:pilus assembly protein CpaC [Sphingomonas naasensis]|uniref:Type II and III secretion system protein family protein n=1 Tax=Sphingomonas naasensis TaxID=1344951 RepID=A0A4S1WNB7_9SPHN|nr:type II and III secretion system protein family protein [Sphingomonas naasensis]NIJ21011.1 pilus assembly protein CpaC [Sphingomonas naasensis]TGX43390.1 type II and III secretion system protein family protein [Sphingomonas naasensis]